jgi:hypothetical protein
MRGRQRCNSGQLLDKLCIGLDLRLAGQEQVTAGGSISVNDLRTGGLTGEPEWSALRVVVDAKWYEER